MKLGAKFKPIHVLLFVIILIAKAELSIDQLLTQSTYTVEYSGVITCPHDVYYCIGAQYSGIGKKNNNSSLSTPLFCSNKSEIYHHATLTFDSNRTWNTTLNPFVTFVHNCTEHQSVLMSKKALKVIQFETQNLKTKESFMIDLIDNTVLGESADNFFTSYTKNIKDFFNEEICVFQEDPIHFTVNLRKTISDEVPPVEIMTHPNSKIVFNTPFDVLGHTQFLEMTNFSKRRIQYNADVTNDKLLYVNPTSGTLGPEESVLLAVYCSQFYYKINNLNCDELTIEWSNMRNPESAEESRLDWFAEHDLVRSKVLKIEYDS